MNNMKLVIKYYKTSTDSSYGELISATVQVSNLEDARKLVDEWPAYRVHSWKLSSKDVTSGPAPEIKIQE